MTQARELEQKIEALAMDRVLAEGPAAGETDNSLRELAAALTGIESLAIAQGFAEVSRTADHLRLVIGSALDSGAGWEEVAGALQEGILRLSRWPSSATCPAWPGEKGEPGGGGRSALRCARTWPRLPSSSGTSR
jgi:hypothetical protein